LGGQRLGDVAAASGTSPADLALDLIERDGAGASMVAFGMDEQDVRTVLVHPRAVVGSDGWTMTVDAARYAHPRSFAFAVRLLARYVRDEAVIDLRQAIAKLSTLPARRIGLTDRGVIEPGAVGDLVVFDLDALSEQSSFETPLLYPQGIDYVLVG